MRLPALTRCSAFTVIDLLAVLAIIAVLIGCSRARSPIEAKRAAGASPSYTEYPDAGHGCWCRAYATPELWDWLRRQRLGDQTHDESTSP